MAYLVKVNQVNRTYTIKRVERKIVIKRSGQRGLPGPAGPQGEQGEQGIQGVPGTPGQDGVVQSIVAGTNVTVDSTDPANPIVSASGGGGGGAVDSVFGRTGAVVAEDNDYAAEQVSFDDTFVSSITAGYLTGDEVQAIIDKFGEGFVLLSGQVAALSVTSRLVRTITLAGHGLSAGNWVRQTGGSESSGGTYVLAQADSLANCEAVWVVTNVADANTFTILLAGYETGMSGLTASTMYYLSPTTPGTITTTKPTTPGQVIKPVMFAVGSTRGYVNGGFISEVVGENLKSANNLSDLGNVATAKTNLALVKADVGLGNVDDTSDANKPISTATQTALNLKLDTSAYDDATTAETDTATSTAKYVSPAGLKASKAGTKPVSVYAVEAATNLSTGDGKAYFRIPAALTGMNLVMVGAAVMTTSSSGTPTVQIARGRQANATSAHSYVDMLSTLITIDANEYDSKDATSAPVINTSNDDVLTGDLIRVDVDAAGTGTKGLIVTMSFQIP